VFKESFGKQVRLRNEHGFKTPQWLITLNDVWRREVWRAVVRPGTGQSMRSHSFTARCAPAKTTHAASRHRPVASNTAAEADSALEARYVGGKTR